MPKVEFLFDFGSPNAYLCHRVIPAIEKRQGVRFDYVPVLLGGIFKATNNRSPAETYAGIRIRGAMLDELRRTDWTPRSVHRKAREVADVVRQIEIETGADADDAEVMKRLGMTADEYHQVLADAASSRLLSLTAPDDGDGGTAMEVVDSSSLSPAEDIEQTGMRQALIDAITTLPEREQLVMSLYYEQELNLKEIGAVLGVTESRVCQIHGQAIIRLRARMTGWRDDED